MHNETVCVTASREIINDFLRNKAYYKISL